MTVTPTFYYPTEANAIRWYLRQRLGPGLTLATERMLVDLENGLIFIGEPPLVQAPPPSLPGPPPPQQTAVLIDGGDRYGIDDGQ